jgi:CHAT domain-containing protein
VIGRGTCVRATLLLVLACCGPSARPPSRPHTSTSHLGGLSDSLLALGERVYLRGAFDTARALWNEALATSRARGDTLAEARALTWLGLAAWRQGDYLAARRIGEEALALKRRLARDAELFKSYNALGLLAWNEGRFTDATRLFGEASAAARAAGDAKGIASASGNLALVQTELGEFDEARRGFDSMRVAGRTLRDDRIEGNALTNLGMLAVRVGDPAAAVPLLDSARARYRAAGYATGEQNALGQLGTAWSALGRPHDALAALDSALELSRRQGVRQDEASNLEAMAEVYRDAGDLRRSLELYAQAEPINRELGLVVEAGADLRSQAEIRAALGALDEARNAAARALEAHREADSRFEELTDLVLLADLEARAGRPRESDSRLDEARALAGKLGVRRARAQVALAEARIADRAVTPLRVLATLRAARRDLAEGGFGIEQEALGLEARALARLGRLDSAAAVGRRAVAALDRVRVSYGSDELKATYVADKQEVYADLAEVLRRQGRTAEAFEVTDAARGRVLIEGLASTRRDSAFHGTAGRGLARGDRLLRSIGALTGQLRETEADLSDATDTSAAAKVRFLRERLASAHREYEELAVRIREVSTPATKLIGAWTTPTAVILAQLAEDEALIEYQPAGDSLLLFVARRRGLRSIAVPLPRGGLAGRVRLARELIATRGGSAARSLPVLGGLGDLLIRPARRSGALADVRTLIVVPHGVLAYLPFAALVDSATGRYLVQDFALLVLPSASSLPALRSREQLGLSEVGSEVFAPDVARLPATGLEATTVARSLPHASLRLGREGTELAARRALAAGHVLHLAAHGELNPWNPMFSWIETAAGGLDEAGDDGRLEVHEILGLPIRSPLVFLSGCETGLGAAGGTGFAQGEDFATLARAFLYAGAANVVATLWRVDDRGAAVFADRFYRRLAADGPAGALAWAQRASLADSAFRLPYYWAGYTLAGDGRTVRSAKSMQVSVR